jgi:hypothetical protein
MGTGQMRVSWSRSCGPLLDGQVWGNFVPLAAAALPCHAFGPPGDWRLR